MKIAVVTLAIALTLVGCSALGEFWTTPAAVSTDPVTGATTYTVQAGEGGSLVLTPDAPEGSPKVTPAPGVSVPEGSGTVGTALVSVASKGNPELAAYLALLAPMLGVFLKK